MGTDNLFHKRRAKRARELERKRARRAPYDKILIITEGGKTEPYYFMELKDYYEINSANIKIDGSGGSSPASVVEYGRKLYRRERDTGDPFDHVYFVFDKDTHPDYQRALNRIATFTPKNTFFAINSVPCFEYWLLLHFAYTTSPFVPKGKISASEAVLHKLREHMPDYDKTAHGIFAALYNQLDHAKSNAARSLEEADKNGTDNPLTRVHELVDYLQNINVN